MKKLLMWLALLLCSLGSALSQPIQPEKLVGTWKLVSWSDVTEKGVASATHGKNPMGFLTYTSDGRVSAVLTNGGRQALSNSRWNLAPIDERAEAFSTSIAYAGSFMVRGEKVFHHVEVCTFQNYVSTDLVRTISKLEDNRIFLRTTTPFFGVDGVQYAYQELVWDRVR